MYTKHTFGPSLSHYKLSLADPAMQNNGPTKAVPWHDQSFNSGNALSAINRKLLASSAHVSLLSLFFVWNLLNIILSYSPVQTSVEGLLEHYCSIASSYH